MRHSDGIFTFGNPIGFVRAGERGHSGKDRVWL